ncbi:MAG: hypothetical protein NVS3B26_18480 [Mycobacteriales bacterium]
MSWSFGADSIPSCSEPEKVRSIREVVRTLLPMATQNPAYVAQVVQELRDGGRLSRTQMQARRGLSRGTIGTAVATLLDQALVLEWTAARTGEMGHPPVLLRLTRRAGLAAGLDVGKRHLRVAVADPAQEVLGERHAPVEADLPATEVLEFAVPLVDDVLAESGSSRQLLVGAGLAVPGPLHAATGELGSATILPT